MKTLLLLAFAASVAMAQSAAGNAENGKKLFVKDNCYSCHGFDGHGGGAGPKLAPRPIAVAAFIAFVRHPAPSAMPTFAPKVVSDQDLRDIWAYLNTIPEPPSPDNILLLKDR